MELSRLQVVCVAGEGLASGRKHLRKKRSTVRLTSYAPTVAYSVGTLIVAGIADFNTNWIWNLDLICRLGTFAPMIVPLAMMALQQRDLANPNVYAWIAKLSSPVPGGLAMGSCAHPAMPPHHTGNWLVLLHVFA